MGRRRIKLAEVIATIWAGPTSVKGRHIYPAKIGRAGRMLLRVIVKEEAHAYQVVTTYKTSKIAKYWRTS